MFLKFELQSVADVFDNRSNRLVYQVKYGFPRDRIDEAIRFSPYCRLSTIPNQAYSDRFEQRGRIPDQYNDYRSQPLFTPAKVRSISCLTKGAWDNQGKKRLRTIPFSLPSD